MAGPAIIVLGNNLIAKWVREKVVCGVEHCVVLVGHTVFLILTRPSAHNKNFPYHVRTTQVWGRINMFPLYFTIIKIQ